MKSRLAWSLLAVLIQYDASSLTGFAAYPNPPAPVPAMKRRLVPGQPVRHASTGHVTNYDETNVGSYRLPDPLALPNRERVRDARTWFELRRPQILQAYETDVFGCVPPTKPSVSFEIVAAGERVEGGAGFRQRIIVHFGAAAGPKAEVVMYVPTGVKVPPPVLLQVVFTDGLPNGLAEPAVSTSRSLKPATHPTPVIPEIGPVAEILRRGYAYATFRYTDVQPDDKETHRSGVEAFAYTAGQSKPAPDEWGTITVWAWAASRVLDYLATDSAVDARHVALIGHSRLGKTALWASALDPRFALVFASCSGEMGAALSRRDYGETVDDMAVTFPWWFAGNFQKYVGHWNDMPVDAHMLIALSAPRPVFITGGTDDQWADPRGEFLAEVAAGPVYRLLGQPDLGTEEMPPVDVTLIKGNLGWRYHAGEHAILPGDWLAFLDFADLHLK